MTSKRNSNKLKELILALFMLSLPNIQHAQSYENYETSNNSSELSFEYMVSYYASELRFTRNFIQDTLKKAFNTNIPTEAFLNYRILKSQKSYLRKMNYSHERLRLCEEEINKLSDQEKSLYKEIKLHIENKYSLTKNEYELIKTVIHKTIKRREKLYSYRDERILNNIALFESYIDLAYKMKYTKLEIFRDSTGFWNPNSIFQNKSIMKIICAFFSWEKFKDIYRKPMNYVSKTAKHGLKASEALRRIKDINNCTNSIE